MGKMSTSRAAATITATQTAEANKKKRKRVALAVSVDTAMASADVETIDNDDEDEDKSPDASTGPATKILRKVAGEEERSRSVADVPDNTGSHKRVKKAPPKPVKPVLWSASK
jgi:hypothetical protein